MSPSPGEGEVDPALVCFLLIIVVVRCLNVIRCEVSAEAIWSFGRRAVYTAFRVHHIWINVVFSKIGVQFCKSVKIP